MLPAVKFREEPANRRPAAGWFRILALRTLEPPVKRAPTFAPAGRVALKERPLDPPKRCPDPLKRGALKERIPDPPMRGPLKDRIPDPPMRGPLKERIPDPPMRGPLNDRIPDPPMRGPPKERMAGAPRPPIPPPPLAPGPPPPHRALASVVSTGTASSRTAAIPMTVLGFLIPQVSLSNAWNQAPTCRPFYDERAVKCGDLEAQPASASSQAAGDDGR
jgi:hypothetical protein